MQSLKAAQEFSHPLHPLFREARPLRHGFIFSVRSALCPLWKLRGCGFFARTLELCACRSFVESVTAGTAEVHRNLLAFFPPMPFQDRSTGCYCLQESAVTIDLY